MGVSLPTVDRWVTAGCPVVSQGGKGRAWEFSLPDVIAWRVERERKAATPDAPTDAEAAKTRKLIAEAQLAELELAKAKDAVALIDEFERAEARLMAIIQQNVMNVPARAFRQLAGVTDERVFKDVLRAELTQALAQSAAAKIEDEEENEPGDDT